MGIMLGNLSLPQIEQRLGITLSEEDKNHLLPMRQEKAEDIAARKWHCFDIPFMIVCGTIEDAREVAEVFMAYADDMKGQLQISWQKGSE